MTFVIIAVVVAVVLFVLLGFRKIDGLMKFRLNSRQFLALLGLAIAIFGCYTIVPANSVGIIYSPFTGVSDTTLPEGIHVKSPLDTVYLLSTEVQTQNLAGISGQTKDAQYLTMSIDIKYRVDAENAFEIFKQFRTLNNMNASLIAPTVQRSIESVTTQYNVIDVLGEFRNEVYTKIEQDLTDRLKEVGVSFYSVTFTDTDAGDDIENAIRAEAVAKKEVETAEQERLKVEIQAQQRVIEAEADRDKASIEAETRLIEAEAEAEANRLIAASITDELIAMKEAEARMEHGWVIVEGGDAIVDVRDANASSTQSSYSSGSTGNASTSTTDAG